MNFIDKNFGRLGNRFFQSAYIYAQFRKGNIPDIYLQDYKYFQEFIPELQEMCGTVERVNYVSIHIRRKDYVGNSFYIDLTQTDYYNKAKLLFPKDEFLVFSDDVDWCMENLDGNLSFSKGNEEDDMRLMMGCKSNIIANSSFSYMCAILNSNKDKIVVAPSVENWYSDSVERTICPETWIRL